MKHLLLASTILIWANGAHAQGFSSEGVPQFPKAGDCNAFWMPGESGQSGVPGATINPQGQWYAIANTDSSDANDPNKGARWQLVTSAISGGQELWVTDPSYVQMPASIPRLILCSVPHAPDGPRGPQMLPNAIPYAYPPRPGFPPEPQ